VLLFFVLFYVFPLKFMFGLMLSSGGKIEAGDARTLFVVYGVGYAAVFLVLSLLYLHAWRRRDELALNDLERLKTRRSLIDHVAMTTVGLVSAVLALVWPARWIGFAGYFYFVVGVYFTIAGFTLGRRERRAAALAGATARVGR